MKHYRYTVIQPNGQIDQLRIPAVFDPFEVANRMHHSEVFMHVPRGHHVWAENAPRLGGLTGPAVVYVHDGNHYQVPNVPRSDQEATQLLADLDQLAR